MAGDPGIPLPVLQVLDTLTRLGRDLAARELLVMLGRLVLLAQASPPSADGKATTTLVPERSISVAQFENLSVEIAHDRQAMLAHSAFTQPGSLRYERLNDAALSSLSYAMRQAMRVAPHELANALTRWWIDEISGAEAYSPPLEVASTMLQLLDTSTSETVYCLGPLAQFAAIECMRQHRVPIFITPHPPLLALLFSLLTDAQMDIQLYDPLSQAAADYFQRHGRKATLAVPSIGTKATEFEARSWHPGEFNLRTAEALTVECAERLAATRAIILVPNGILFLPGTEQRLRAHLVERGHVQTVVSFPPGLLSSTALPFSLLVIETGRSLNETLFYEVDARRDLKTSPGRLKHKAKRFLGEQGLLAALRSASPPALSIPCSAIKATGYNLSANRYRPVPERSDSAAALGHTLVTFDDIASIIKPQAFRALGADEAVTIGEVSPGELPIFDFLTTAARQRTIPRRDWQRFAHQRLRYDDVLLSTKGSIGRVGIARPEPQASEIFPSQSIIILRLNPRGPFRDPIALLMYLRSPTFQQLLQSLVVGTTIPNVSLTDLRRLAIRAPSLEEQLELSRTFVSQRRLQQQIDALVAEQQQAEKQAWTATKLDVPEI